MLQLEPYKGNGRVLVLAIDIGTTYSGVAYCVLDPGEIPKVLSVTRYATPPLTRSDDQCETRLTTPSFPGQEGKNKSRDVKIPSVLYYDQGGNLRAVGAAAMLPNVQEDAYEHEWTLIKWCVCGRCDEFNDSDPLRSKVQAAPSTAVNPSRCGAPSNRCRQNRC